MGRACHTRLLLNLFEWQDTSGRSLSTPPRIGDAGQLKRRLVLPQGERRTVRPQEKNRLAQRLHQRAVNSLPG